MDFADEGDNQGMTEQQDNSLGCCVLIVTCKRRTPPLHLGCGDL
jgi:hypothetical protein